MDFNRTIKLIPDRFEFAIFPEEGITVTGADLQRFSGICASWLQQNGYEKVGIHMGNSPEFLYIFAGALRAGVRTVLFNALDEIQTDLPFFKRKNVRDIIEKHVSSRAVFTPYEWKADEPLLVISTSGTSGQRKQVEKSIKSIFGQNGIRPLWRFILGLFKFKMYNSPPWYHQFGLFSLMLSLCGAQVTEITAEHFNPDHMRQSINRYHPEILVATPSMLFRCFHSGEIDLPPYYLCAGEPLSERLLQYMEKAGGAQILYSTYGTTEAVSISQLTYFFERIRLSGKICLSLLRMSKYGGACFNKDTLPPLCTGALLKDVDVRIMKGETLLGEGERGELHVRTSTMAPGSETSYSSTGDIGYLKDGLLFISGRSSNLINRSGEKIIPQDIENVLADFQGVKSTVVFGIPSESYGEDICAAIESEYGAPVLNKSDLEGRLPKYMIPQHLFFFEKFPLNATGKADLSAIKNDILQKI